MVEIMGTSMLLYLYSPDSEPEMDAVFYTRPSQTVGFRFGDQFRDPVNEIQPIIIGPEYLPSFDPPDDHMMQRPWRDSRLLSLSVAWFSN